MPSDGSVFGGMVAAVALGLVALVYGMEMSAGQSWNTPSIVGGVIVLVAVGAMVLRIANLDSPE